MPFDRSNSPVQYTVNMLGTARKSDDVAYFSLNQVYRMTLLDMHCAFYLYNYSKANIKLQMPSG